MKKLFTIFAGLLITISVSGQTGEIIAIPHRPSKPGTVMITLGVGCIDPLID